MTRAADPAAVTRGGQADPEGPAPGAAAADAAQAEIDALADALALGARSRRLCAQLVARPAVRQTLRDLGRQQRLHTLLREAGVRGVERAAHEMLDLYQAGATRAELLAFGRFLDEVAEDLFVGAGREARDALERAEAAADTHEDLLQVEGLCALERGAETPALLRTRADALRGQAAASAALAGRLEFDARRAERVGALA